MNLLVAFLVVNIAFAKALPEQAVVEIDDKHYVLILSKKNNNQYFFKQEQVILKDSYDGFVVVEYKNGFKPDAQFLIKGTFQLIGN